MICKIFPMGRILLDSTFSILIELKEIIITGRYYRINFTEHKMPMIPLDHFARWKINYTILPDLPTKYNIQEITAIIVRYISSIPAVIDSCKKSKIQSTQW